MGVSQVTFFESAFKHLLKFCAKTATKVIGEY